MCENAVEHHSFAESIPSAGCCSFSGAQKCVSRQNPSDFVEHQNANYKLAEFIICKEDSLAAKEVCSGAHSQKQDIEEEALLVWVIFEGYLFLHT